MNPKLHNPNNSFWTEILPLVERPSRYLGTEWNAICKDSDKILLRVALVFPDLYELGLGNLGLQILYSILNQHSQIWAERVYAPAPDLEQILRQKNQPLFLWESKDPVKASHLVGFTLQSELTYTTVLNILDLAQIPIFAKDRTEADPLICAGGPCCLNPEPMAPFIDFFVIGEGEEIIQEIAEILLSHLQASRQKKLELLSELDGIYVPGRIPLVSNQQGILVPDPSQKRIRRAISKKLTPNNYIQEYIVPFTPLVHDGLSIEVMRGCTRGCRFCLAGCAFRPIRERTPDDVSTILASLLPNTGLETVSLVSLSTCDHSQIQQLLQKTRLITQPAMTGISLPSLRLDSFSVILADTISSIRRSGLTFAPEAGSERLRKLINKSVTDDDLMEIIQIAFQKGWTHVKLYFMIGLPTETDEDIASIIQLALQSRDKAKKIRPSARIHLGISTFVPKPWTPFQWERQISLSETIEKQKKILHALRKHKAIKINFHTPESSLIEGLISRADRQISNVIFSTWQQGARLETSADLISFQHWLHALQKHHLSEDFFLRPRSHDEIFPWDFIDAGISKQWVWNEWQSAQNYNITEDCRETSCHLCGIHRRKDLTCLHWRKEKHEPIIEIHSSGDNPSLVPLPPSQRLLLKIGKTGPARFLSHLEFQTAWIRSLRRTQLPLAYTHGYHAHARLSMALPAPVGETLLEEYLEIWLQSEVDDLNKVQKQLTASLPHGFLLHSIEPLPLNYPSLMGRVAGLHYALIIEPENPFPTTELQNLSDFIQFQLKTIVEEKDKTSSLPLPPFTIDHEIDKNLLFLQWLSPVIQGQFLKPKTIMEYLRNNLSYKQFHPFRIHTFLDSLPATLTPFTYQNLIPFLPSKSI